MSEWMWRRRLIKREREREREREQKRESLWVVSKRNRERERERDCANSSSGEKALWIFDDEEINSWEKRESTMVKDRFEELCLCVFILFYFNLVREGDTVSLDKYEGWGKR